MKRLVFVRLVILVLVFIRCLRFITSYFVVVRSFSEVLILVFLNYLCFLVLVLVLVQKISLLRTI